MSGNGRCEKKGEKSIDRPFERFSMKFKPNIGLHIKSIFFEIIDDIHDCCREV
jgi:hypothetical protein